MTLANLIKIVAAWTRLKVTERPEIYIKYTHIHILTIFVAFARINSELIN